MLQLNPADIQAVAVKTLKNEAEAISGLIPRIGDNFIQAIDLLAHTNGRVIVTGIGKSADIGRKIVSTFNSTGTPSVFMHAADAIHGDLGTITPNDTIICLSKSGNTPEIKVLIPLLKSQGNTLIAIVGNPESYLGTQCDVLLDTSVEREACPNNLAPTSSTTAQLAMGDALAVALLTARGFTPDDFARVRLGTAAVLHDGKLVGIVTDGDLRRMLQKHTDIQNLSAKDIMSSNPRTIQADSMVVDALQVMRQNNITQLLVVKDDNYLGVIHLHDILKEGII